MKYYFKPYEKSEIMSGHLNLGGCNPFGEEIDVTSLYLTRNKKPWLPVTGEYHFSRDAREHWYEELCKMKAGGVGIVTAYVIWIYHEEIEGQFDFTGDNDLHYFLECVKKAGMEMVLRIGPWAHGECRNGGFPDWLLKKGCPLRCDDPEYLGYVRTFYEKIYEQVKDFLFSAGGNIIAVQVENELTDQPEHLLTLKRMAQEIGYDVPLYTVTGWNNIYGAKIPVDEVLPLFAAYVEAPWAESIEKLPLSKHYIFDPTRNDCAVGMDIIGKCDDDGWRLPYEKYPYATCELGPGLQMTHHRRVIVSGMDAYAMSLVKLGCGNNLIGYYMYHGGTNKIGQLSTLQESMATDYPNNMAIINYDFQTCLSSYGEAREQYELLNLLHLFVEDQGEKLATMEYVPATEHVTENNLTDLRYCMRTDGESGYIFVNHYQRQASMEDCKNVEFVCGETVFPPIDICGDISFILPFGLDDIVWATAQYLCKQDDTYFFMEIPGIEPQIRVKDGAQINTVLLSIEEAKKLRRLNGRLYIGDDCNLYEMDGAICAMEDGDFSYRQWCRDHFERAVCEKASADAVLTMEECEPAFEIPYPEELQYGYPDCPANPPRAIRWKRLEVTGSVGFVEIDEVFDVAQIYGDGILLADYYYCKKPWRVPGALLAGKECYLVMSELRDDIYLEEKI